MPLAGSYAWHPSGDGLIVILARESGQETHTLWGIDAATTLTIPETAPLRISNLKWVLSPDSEAIAYRGADFLGLWVLNFGMSLGAILMPAPRTILSQAE